MCDFAGVPYVMSQITVIDVVLLEKPEHVCILRKIIYYNVVSVSCVIYIPCGCMSAVYFCLLAVWGYKWIREDCHVVQTVGCVYLAVLKGGNKTTKHYILRYNIIWCSSRVNLTWSRVAAELAQ